MYIKPTPTQINKLFEALACMQRDLQQCSSFLSNHIVSGEYLSLYKDMHRLSGKVEKARLDFIGILKGTENE